jgi:uncharacterized repeat protein (TIGR03803 family)
MKLSNIIGFMATVVFAGCLLTLTADAWAESVIHSFQGSSGVPPDGSAPRAGMIYFNGALYGTTSSGGPETSACGSDGCGTVFSVDLSTNTEGVLYSFKGNVGCNSSGTSCTSYDGENPYYGSLLNVGGTLYGTTQIGGNGAGSGCNQGCGTVFSIDPKTGVEKMLYAFQGDINCTNNSGTCDGSYPWGGLIDLDDMLYGTTTTGGMCNACGTVFSLDPKTGVEKVLHSFQGGANDGDTPYAGLIDVKGTLYGTTLNGGNNNCGCGTVFSINPKTGVESVVYAFNDALDCNSNCDGREPWARLLNVGSILYGTTYYGGTGTACGSLGCGTVFSIDLKTGVEEVLYSFKGGNDGDNPAAPLIMVKDALYGTTYADGAGCSGAACGTLFSVDPKTGAETVVYSFCSLTGCADGGGPYAGLIDVKGTLYGTTIGGGDIDAGTIYAIKP